MPSWLSSEDCIHILFFFPPYHHWPTNNPHKKIIICKNKYKIHLQSYTRPLCAFGSFFNPPLQLLICKNQAENTNAVMQFFFFFFSNSHLIFSVLFSRLVLKENCCHNVLTEIRRGLQGSWPLQGHCRGSLNVTWLCDDDFPRETHLLCQRRVVCRKEERAAFSRPGLVGHSYHNLMQLGQPDWWRRGKDGIASVRWAKFIKHFQPGDMGHLTGNASRRLSHFQNVYDVQSINIISPRDDHHSAKVKLAASALIRESCTKWHIRPRRLGCGVGVGLGGGVSKVHQKKKKKKEGIVLQLPSRVLF